MNKMLNTIRTGLVYGIKNCLKQMCYLVVEGVDGDLISFAYYGPKMHRGGVKNPILIAGGIATRMDRRQFSGEINKHRFLLLTPKELSRFVNCNSADLKKRGITNLASEMVLEEAVA